MLVEFVGDSMAMVAFWFYSLYIFKSIVTKCTRFDQIKENKTLKSNCDLSHGVTNKFYQIKQSKIICIFVKFNRMVLTMLLVILIGKNWSRALECIFRNKRCERENDGHINIISYTVYNCPNTEKISSQ